MFILIINLGEEYIVWDRSASIEFLKPGKGSVYADFSISQEEISNIKENVDSLGKNVFEFPCEVRDEKGMVVAKLNKGVCVRKKNFVAAKS